MIDDYPDTNEEGLIVPWDDGPSGSRCRLGHLQNFNVRVRDPRGEGWVQPSIWPGPVSLHLSARVGRLDDGDIIHERRRHERDELTLLRSHDGGGFQSSTQRVAVS